jgi:hypothetical protein
LGLACGFVLVEYGFNLIASGLAGAREFTSQFLAVNLLLGGSATVFVSLYYLLKPAATQPTLVPQPVSGGPDVGVETIVEEETPPKAGFYKKIEYIGYFFAFLGLVSAADLVLQVFLRSIYSEARWWVEVLLVTFGVLSYVIFGSVGRLGAQEEAKLTTLPLTPKLSAENIISTPTEAPTLSAAASVEPLDLKLADFTRSPTGEYERHLSGDSYDMFRVDRDVITIWREIRTGIRSSYLAGPYELTRKILEEYASGGRELRIGYLILSTDTVRALIALQEKPPVEHPAAQTSV